MKKRRQQFIEQNEHNACTVINLYYFLQDTRNKWVSQNLNIKNCSQSRIQRGDCSLNKKYEIDTVLIYVELLECALDTKQIIGDVTFSNTQRLIHLAIFHFFEEPFSFTVDFIYPRFLHFS